MDINITANSIIVKTPDIALLQVCRDDGTGGTTKIKTQVRFPQTFCFENLGLQDWDMDSADQWASYKRSIIPGNINDFVRSSAELNRTPMFESVSGF